MRAESIVSLETNVTTQDSKTLPKEVWLTSLAHFSNDFYNGFLAPLLPMLVLKLDISLALAGLLVSILSIFNSLSQPIAGIIADRLQRNYFIVFAALITGLFMSLIGVVDQYITLAIVLALSGIGTSLFHPQGAAFVGRIKSKRPGFSMSFFSMGGSFGFAVGPLIVVPLVIKFGLSATIYTTVFAVFVLFFTFPLLKQTYVRPVKKRPNVISALKGHYILVSLLFFMVVIRATMTIAFHSFMPLYLTSEGQSLFLGATALTVFQVCGTIGILVGGFFSDRMKSSTLLMVSFLFALPFAIAFVHLPSVWGIPFFGITAFFLFSSTPVNILMGQRILPENASFISGIMMGFAWGIGGILATPIGALADQFGLYTTLFVIALLAIPGVLLARYCTCDIKK